MEIKRHLAVAEAPKHCVDNYRAIFESAAESIIIWNEAGRILEVNPSACTCFGYSREELTTMQINHLDSREEAQYITERIKTLLEHGHALYVAIQRHKDETLIRMEVNASRIVWDGQIAFCNIYRHLSERKQNNVLIGESETRLRAITNSTKDAIVMMGEKGLVSFWNPAAERIFGYAAYEAVGRNLHTLLAPSRYHKAHAAAFRQFQQTGEGKAIDTTLELEACHWDGHEISIELSLSKLHVQGAWHTIGIIRDITERKKAEEELRESEERFRTLHDASFGGILIHDQGLIIDCNQGLSEISGYTMDELIGMDGLQLIAPDWRSMVMEKIRSGYGAAYDVEGLRKDGTTYPLSIRGSNIPYKGREVRVTELRDITTRKIVEEKHKQLEAQLMQAQKMEAIGTLAGGVAHDLNNILCGIVSYPEMLLLNIPEDSPLRKPLLTVQKSGEKATKIVQDLLTMARRGVSIAEVVNINEIIAEQLKSPEMTQLQTFHPNVKVISKLEPDLLNVKGSPIHLAKSIMNLIFNAAEAMQDGGEVTISTSNLYLDSPVRGYEHIEKGDFVKVTVFDTGTGMSKEEIEKIFEPFYTKKTMGRSGTGLGMTVVWGTVKDHRGYIDIQSSEGQGSTFALYLPVTRETLKESDIETPIEEYKGKGESILIIDDIEEQREIATAILKNLDYSVASASSGEEALEYLKNNSADLLILDMIMGPGMDGLKTYKCILEQTSRQKAVIVSGYSRTEQVKELQKLGAEQYIKKPYTMKKIGFAVKKELGE